MGGKIWNRYLIEKAIIRVLEDEEYRKELYKKLQEETSEVIGATNSKEILEELADVFEILRSIAELRGKTLDDVLKTANQKKLKRGGFEKRIFLEKTYKN
ncbi:MAG: nucleoside triphosphate pyrophosphohydrolase [Bacilli bacterium]|nr:nucleoside triphosphate pyrophosphohydrolase [Bacilli bacterium]